MDYNHFTIHPTSNVSDILVLCRYLNFVGIFGTMDEGISHPEKSRFHVILSLLRVWLLRAWNQWNKDVKPWGTCWKKTQTLASQIWWYSFVWLWNLLNQIFVAVWLCDSPLSRHRLLLYGFVFGSHTQLIYWLLRLRSSNMLGVFIIIPGYFEILRGAAKCDMLLFLSNHGKMEEWRLSNIWIVKGRVESLGETRRKNQFLVFVNLEESAINHGFHFPQIWLLKEG